MGVYWGEPVRFKFTADPVVYHNLSVGRQWDNGVSVWFGIPNVLGEEPPFVSKATGNTIANSARYPQYDLRSTRLAEFVL